MADGHAQTFTRGAHQLLELLERAGDERMSQATLGAELQVGARQVRRYLDELEAAGRVLRIRGGRGHTSSYTIVEKPQLDRTFDRTSREEHTEAMSGLTQGNIGDLTGHLTGHPRARAILAGEANASHTPLGSPQQAELSVDQRSRSNVILAAFLDAWKGAGFSPPTDRFKGHLGAQIERLLDAGIPVADVQAGIGRMVQRKVMQPSLLENFVLEAQAAQLRRVDRPRAARYGRGMTARDALNDAHS